MSAGPRVSVKRRFDVSPERVFDAWLDPEMIGRWMFGSALREEEVMRIALDARVGGSFSFLVRRQGQDIDHVGKYLEIDPPRRLVFTWGVGEDDGSRVTVEIVRSGAGCELTLTHDMPPQWADYAERTEMGWTRMVNALAAMLGAA
jgi:uncharacterized protein YndB with AHSA1/START domain